MADNMKDARQHAKFCAKTEAHINVSDLCDRGIRNHSADAVFPDRIDRSDDHACNSEHEQHMNHFTVPYHLKSDYTVKDLEQQENVSL